MMKTRWPLIFFIPFILAGLGCASYGGYITFAGLFDPVATVRRAGPRTLWGPQVTIGCEHRHTGLV